MNCLWTCICVTKTYIKMRAICALFCKSIDAVTVWSQRSEIAASKVDEILSVDQACVREDFIFKMMYSILEYMHAAQCMCNLRTCDMLHSLLRVGRWVKEVNVYRSQTFDLELCCLNRAAGLQMLDKHSEKYCTGSVSCATDSGLLDIRVSD